MTIFFICRGEVPRLFIFFIYCYNYFGDNHNHMLISIIIPAYNEEKRIERTLFSISEYLSGHNYNYEIIVVNDGSKDKTAEIVNGLKHRIQNLNLIDNKDNHGKGWVVRQGMLEARGDIILFTDADNSTTVDHLEKMLPYFHGGYDIVIGSRRVLGSIIAVHQAGYKEFLGRLGNLWIRIFAVNGINDTQAGFKAFTARAAKIVFPRETLDRWGFDFEALAIAKKHKLKIKEMPIRWVNDAMSHVKFSAYAKTLIEALKIRWNLLTGKYK